MDSKIVKEEYMPVHEHSLIVTCCENVFKEFGPGFKEDIYKEAIAIELKSKNITYEHKRPVIVKYKGTVVGVSEIYFVVDSCMALSVKHLKTIGPFNDAKSNLKKIMYFADINKGIIVNFGMGDDLNYMCVHFEK